MHIRRKLFGKLFTDVCMVRFMNKRILRENRLNVDWLNENIINDIILIFQYHLNYTIIF